jgi:hypothetical protein
VGFDIDVLKLVISVLVLKDDNADESCAKIYKQGRSIIVDLDDIAIVIRRFNIVGNNLFA